MSEILSPFEPISEYDVGEIGSVYGLEEVTMTAEGADVSVYVSDEIGATLIEDTNGRWWVADNDVLRGMVLFGGVPFVDVVALLDDEEGEEPSDGWESVNLGTLDEPITAAYSEVADYYEAHGIRFDDEPTPSEALEDLAYEVDEVLGGAELPYVEQQSKGLGWGAESRQNVLAWMSEYVVEHYGINPDDAVAIAEAIKAEFGVGA